MSRLTDPLQNEEDDDVISPEVEDVEFEVEDEGEEALEAVELGAFPPDEDPAAQVKWLSLWLAKNKLYRTLDTLLDEYPETLEDKLVEQVPPS